MLVVSTCNRLEVYADVSAFHPAVSAIGESLAQAAGAQNSALADHLYVRYDDSAVAHAFTVASGLDSMAVGESQILGQMRESLASAQAMGAAGESLNDLFQQALRVGKRAHSETDIDQHSVSLVQIGLERARDVLGPLDGVRACVVGAGGMSGLAVASVVRAGVSDLTIVNRTEERAARLAETWGGTHRPWDHLPAVVAESDLVITSTGAVGHVITGSDVALSAATRDGRPQLFDSARAEVALAVHRIVEKLLHTPTKRVKEFATESGGQGHDYAAALRELFDLEPKDVANVSAPPKRVI